MCPKGISFKFSSHTYHDAIPTQSYHLFPHMGRKQWRDRATQTKVSIFSLAYDTEYGLRGLAAVTEISS